MHSAENTADRELSDAELNDVSGGILPELVLGRMRCCLTHRV